MTAERDLSAFSFRSVRTDELTADDRARMFALFDVAYRQANHAYLEKSFGVLHYAAIATCGDDSAGFALGEMRILDLPRLPQQVVAMAGICCIGPAYRRHGLFGALERKAMERRRYRAAGRDDERRADGASGELSHDGARTPVSCRRSGVVPTAWQQEVGAAIAAAYGTAEFDPKTFVCHGSGVPIGYPAMDLDVEPHEWEAFKHVDRDKGDSLLGLSWMPDPPEGWEAG